MADEQQVHVVTVQGRLGEDDGRYLFARPQDALTFSRAVDLAGGDSDVDEERLIGPDQVDNLVCNEWEEDGSDLPREIPGWMIEDGMEALFAVVARYFPHVPGDLGPGEVQHMQNEIKQWFGLWLDNGRPEWATFDYAGVNDPTGRSPRPTGIPADGTRVLVRGRNGSGAVRVAWQPEPGRWAEIVAFASELTDHGTRGPA